MAATGLMGSRRLVGVVAASVLMAGACGGGGGDRSGPGGGQSDDSGAQTVLGGGGGGERAGVVGGLEVSSNRGFVSFSADAGCAFRADETMECWAPLNGEVEPEGFVAVDGRDGAPQCGIRVDGTLRCWGRYVSDGAEGDPGVPYEEFPFGERRFLALSAGELACAIDFDLAVARTDYGYVVQWGRWLPEGEFASVSAGDFAACGVRVDATLGCLDLGEFAVPDGEFVSVAVGHRDACAMRVGGQVMCRGETDSDDDSGPLSPPDGDPGAAPIGATTAARSGETAGATAGATSVATGAASGRDRAPSRPPPGSRKCRSRRSSTASSRPTSAVSVPATRRTARAAGATDPRP